LEFGLSDELKMMKSSFTEKKKNRRRIGKKKKFLGVI